MGIVAVNRSTANRSWRSGKESTTPPPDRDPISNPYDFGLRTDAGQAAAERATSMKYLFNEIPYVSVRGSHHHMPLGSQGTVGFFSALVLVPVLHTERYYIHYKCSLYLVSS